MIIVEGFRELNHGLLLGALLILAVSSSWFPSLLAQHLYHLRTGRRRDGEMLRLSLPTDDRLPHVLVQLPIYNEPTVARRLVEAVVDLDWPRERLHVQVLDDSTDETASVLRELTARLSARGLDVTHLYRRQRTGFKAGALREGLERAAHEYVAVFDADFIPQRDFLRLCLRPLIADPGLAFVQARWEFTNGGRNLVTRAQRAILDGYFGVMQTAQSWSGNIVDYNGTCAVWRRAAIDDAGGWSADTLGEDGDLSYRAQLRGWRALYLSSVIVPGELPDSLAALRAQQSRWGMAWGQLARKHWLGLWRSDLGLSQKIAATGQMLATTSGMVLGVAIASAVIDYLLGSTWSAASATLAGAAILESAGAVITMATLAQVEFDRAGAWVSLRDGLAGVLLFGLVHVWAGMSVIGGLGGRTAAYVRTPKTGEMPDIRRPIHARAGDQGSRGT
jgi:cellulose synthase/poly-beta-1,6-N-acetylglucosamine synthase-like glycosyltransferase